MRATALSFDLAGTYDLGVAEWEQLRIEDVGAGVIRVPTPPPPDARARLLELRRLGLGLRRTGRILEAEGYVTANGCDRWWPSTVARTERPDRHAAYMRRYRRR